MANKGYPEPSLPSNQSTRAVPSTMTSLPPSTMTSLPPSTMIPLSQSVGGSMSTLAGLLHRVTTSGGVSTLGSKTADKSLRGVNNNFISKHHAGVQRKAPKSAAPTRPPPPTKTCASTSTLAVLIPGGNNPKIPAPPGIKSYPTGEKIEILNEHVVNDRVKVCSACFFKKLHLVTP